MLSINSQASNSRAINTGVAPETAPARRQFTDFDFGEARRDAKAPRKRSRPGLTAGLVAFAFALSMFIPVGARAEPAWKFYPGQLSAPTKHDTNAEIIPVDSKRWKRADRDKPRRNALPEVCSLQIDGPRGGLDGYSENCLRDRGLNEPLPRRCATNARLFGQRDRIYAADCLREARFDPRYR